jgi:hypothetical protein
MTIHWDPDDPIDPDTIEISHVAEDGTTSGPITADVSDVDGMPDLMGGIAPDAVRERTIEFVKTASWTDPLTKQVVFDMLSLNYEQGSPPSQ